MGYRTLTSCQRGLRLSRGSWIRAGVHLLWESERIAVSVLIWQAWILSGSRTLILVFTECL